MRADFRRGILVEDLQFSTFGDCGGVDGHAAKGWTRKIGGHPEAQKEVIGSVGGDTDHNAGHEQPPEEPGYDGIHARDARKMESSLTVEPCPGEIPRGTRV